MANTVPIFIEKGTLKRGSLENQRKKLRVAFPEIEAKDSGEGDKME